MIGKEALRSDTSVGAHYREAIRARSNAAFVSKIDCGLQELEETRYWLELMVESGIMSEEKLNELFHESEELTVIFLASAKTAKRGIR